MSTADTTDTPRAGKQKVKRPKHLCRTCLFEHKNMTSIFLVDNGFDITYSEMISDVTGVQIFEDDGYTPFICAVCKQNAKVAYQYKLLARRADKTLRNAAPGTKRFASKIKFVEKAKLKVKKEVKAKMKKIKIEGKYKAKKVKKERDIIENENSITVVKSEKKFNIENVDEDDDRFDDGFAAVSYDFPSLPAFPVDSFDDMVKQEKKELEVPLSQLDCVVCGSVFDSLSALSQHQLACTKGSVSLTIERVEEKANYCPICGANFDNALSLVQHARTHNDLMTGGSSSWVSPSDDASAHATYNPLLTVRKKKLGKTGKTNKTKKSTKKPKAHSMLWKTDIDEEAATRDKPDEEVQHIQGVPEYPRCGICSLMFNTQEKLDNHFMTHSKTKVMLCTLCDKLFLEPMYFRRHLAYGHHHEEVASDKLATDQVKTTDIGELMNSYKEAHPDNLYLAVCPQCGKMTMSARDLFEHNNKEHPEFNHRCPQCCKLFSDENTVQTHRRYCVPSERYECKICGQKFVREIIMSQHMQSKHDPKVDQLRQQAFPCYICGKQFSKFEALDKHKFRMHRQLPADAKAKIYECDVCHTKVRDKTNLAAHIRTHDPKRGAAPQRHLCRFCGIRVTEASNLVVHIRRAHTGEKPFKCQFCGKAFVRTSDKTEHERIHTGHRPYACQVCGKRFIKSWVLTKHMRVHTGERPYKCGYCGQGFTQSQDMRKHERRHTGESAYSCSACGESFTQAKHLSEHKAICIRVSAPTLPSNDPHLALIKGQMELARSYLGQA